jgi:hypothetical protein
MESYAFVQGAMKFPSYTLITISRRDIGYRILSPAVLFAVFGLLAVVTIVATAGNDAANPMHLLIFAGIGFANGIAQRIRRWRDVNRGVATHSYYIGTCPLDFPWLPYFVRRNRRVARFAEPALWAIIGVAIFPYSRALGLWLVFAALSLRGFEDQVFRRERNRDLDLGDAVIIAEDQARVLEQYEQSQNPPQQQNSAGIPSGIGDDIKRKIHKNNPSLN